CARIRSDYRVSVKDPEPSKYAVLASGAVSYPKGSTIEVRGRRTTWFAFRVGRVMRMSDDRRVILTLTQPPTPMGVPGMDPAMMGMDPAMAGMEAGMPGGMPGMGAPAPRPGSQRSVYDVTATDVVEFVPPGESQP
ncbi:MAG: hypothetical protein QHJ73_04235, partial [Armatimonadota bacterium]|nr:hypothetical protein [Armatimonadota bacterium]